jgi:hypothetical protein
MPSKKRPRRAKIPERRTITGTWQAAAPDRGVSVAFEAIKNLTALRVAFRVSPRGASLSEKNWKSFTKMILGLLANLGSADRSRRARARRLRRRHRRHRWYPRARNTPTPKAVTVAGPPPAAPTGPSPALVAVAQAAMKGKTP